MVHLYFGDGKGKTSAAVGMAVRAAGNGKKVVFVQFMKDGCSGENEILKDMKNISFLCCEKKFGFFKDMNGETKREAAEACGELLKKCAAMAEKGGFLILDELTHAVNFGFANKDEVKKLLMTPDIEIVVTGRCPEKFMFEAADYVSEIKKIKHPYDNGAAARKGVEF